MIVGGSTVRAVAYAKLDAAVFAAYGWDPAMTDDQLLESLLALNLHRAQISRRLGEGS